MGMDFRLEPLGRWGAEQILLPGCAVPSSKDGEIQAQDGTCLS